MKRINKLLFLSAAFAALVSAGCVRKMDPVEILEPETTWESGPGDESQAIATAETYEDQATNQDSSSQLMTLEELASLERFLNEEDGYGFLLSEYESPEYMDINQVFYTGAGMDPPPLSEEEREAFLKTTGDSEIYTDITRLTKAQIEEYLKKYAGIGLSDIKTRFYWVYIPQFDSYYSQHGDTNKVLFTCESGMKQDGIYRAECRSSQSEAPSYRCAVSLERTEDGWRFLSNEILEDGLYIRENQAKEDSMSSMRLAVENYRRSRGFSGMDYGSAIFDSDIRYYTTKEMLKLDPKLYPVFRNEIYARHGYIFKNEKWNDFFADYRWYQGRYGGDEFDTEVFNQFEDVNLKLVQELEK